MSEIFYNVVKKQRWQPLQGMIIFFRIMVPSEYVGAVIGRKGTTIKSITQRCKAR